MPCKPKELRRSNGSRKKGFNGVCAGDPLTTRVESLDMAHKFLNGPSARDSGLSQLREALIKSLHEGLSHPNARVQNAARKIFEDLRKKGKLEE